MKVRVSWYLTQGNTPEADRFECDAEDVQAGLREPLGRLPLETLGAVKLGLTAAMPEALRTHGTWTYAEGPLMVKVSRTDT